MRDISETGSTPGYDPLAASAAGSVQDRVNRLRAAAKARLDGTSTSLSLLNGMQAFCRGAGIDGEKIPITSDAQMLNLAGRLMRVALVGLREILRAQSDFSDRYGIRREKTEGRSPLEVSLDEYLIDLFCGHEERRLDAVIRLREQFTDAAQHANSVDPALRSALSLFVGHLDPARMDGLPGDTGMARYKDIYANLLRANGSEAPHLFVEALAQAYLDARRAQR
jgi:predicted component of type VI protein secretion system